MKLKKIYALAASLLLTASGALCAEPEVSVDTVKYSINKMIFDGALSTDSAVNITMLITRKSGGDEIFSVGELKSNGGKFTFNVTMPDVVTDYYKVKIQADGGNVVEKDFFYVSKAERNDFFSLVKSDLSQISDMLSEENNYYKWKSAGFEIDMYNRLTDEQKRTAENCFKATENITELPEESLAEVFNRCVYLVKYNAAASQDEADLIFAQMNFSWSDFPEITETQSDILNRQLYKEKPYVSVDNMSDTAYRVNALYEIGNAKTAQIESALSKYCDKLGYKDNTIYKSYLSISDKTDTNKKLVNLMYSGNDYTVNGLMQKLENAMNTKTGGTGSSGGNYTGGSSGGTGSSGSKKGGSPIGNVTLPSENDDNKDIDIFSDLDTTLWAKESITALYKRGIISGYEDKTVRPNRNITREEFVTMLVKALGIKSGTTNGTFEDITENMWCEPYVGAAFENKIVCGISETEFGVGKNITRQDMALMAYNAAKGSKNMDGYKNDFADWDSISDYAKNSVAALCSDGIISGREGGIFAPREFCTRAEAAIVIYKLFIK